MPNQIVYFISGANRGIGLALVEEMATRDLTAVIYAGARDPESASALQGQISFNGFVKGLKGIEGRSNICDQL